jgi:hypothetical protein
MESKYNKFTKVLTFQDWEDLYSLPKNKENKINLVNEETATYGKSDELKLLRKEVLDVLHKNKKALIEVEEKMVEYVQLETIYNPSVYIAILKDTRNPEFENVTAKTFWPLVGGGKKEIRIYLGRLSEFAHLKRSDITTDKTIKEKAHKMMKDYLSEKYKNGELPKYPRIPDYILKK